VNNKQYTAAVLVIGNEILSGRTQDVNLAYLGTQLNASGIRLMEARVLPDIEEAIVDALNEVRARYDYIFTTGGIGPTHDDITAACVAKAFEMPLIQNPDAVRILQSIYSADQLNEARLRMASMPEGAELIDNPVSKAPGFRIGNVFVLAGVPVIAQAMFEGLRHQLVGGDPLRARSLTVFLPEGYVAKDLGALQDRYPDVEIGSYPFTREGRFGTRLVLRTTDPQELIAASTELEAMIQHLEGEYAWDPETGG
jgi:molybdenum cofactor synthesis domain-containing protein